ncbi:MAG: YdeI/OmpD-associated family protein [Thermoproteota archaeon]|nr:YdeI/OmpD-associated family protein [Thermoproteota archaeon]
MQAAKPKFFKTSVALRGWLEKYHHSATELWVGFYKVTSGRKSISWPDAVDQALCFGWIDGLRKSLDEISYTIRFTQRKQKSTWSAVNIRRAKELSRAGLLSASGRRAFEKRTDEKAALYSYEQRKDPRLNKELALLLRANKKAWKFFKAQAASYQKTAIWWVISAKKEETKMKRLAALIGDSAAGRAIAPLRRRPKTMG